MLPLLSQVRSSQAVMGSLVKDWWAKKMEMEPSDIYHVTAMPCYDKKLEASRSDFYSSIYSIREVDCVLTTGELDLLLSELGFDPYTSYQEEMMNGHLEPCGTSSRPWPDLITHEGSSSGSYLATIVQGIATTHANPTRVVTKEIRGSTDNVEYLLEDCQTGEIIFKGVKCYGFRNLQNLVRKVGKETGLIKSVRPGGNRLSAAMAARRRKAKTSLGEVSTPIPTDSDAESVIVKETEEKKIDFVEVMACPSGCVNGGGQMKPVKEPTGMEVDEEGYARPLADDGTDVAMGVAKVRVEVDKSEGTRWSTKEWVAKVEEVYWNGLPTPPPSRSTSPELDKGSVESTHSVRSGSERTITADAVSAEVMMDIGAGEAEWEFLRTRFRKVEGDILSNGGLTHEAVKW